MECEALFVQCWGMGAGLRVLRNLLQAEGEHPAFIRRPVWPLLQHIRLASSSPAMCEDGSRYRTVATASILARASGKCALRQRIVGRLAGSAEVERHAVLIGPPMERFRDELGTIIHPDGVRCSAC